MRKLGKRITGAVLAATMLVFGSDITVLAAETDIVAEEDVEEINEGLPDEETEDFNVDMEEVEEAEDEIIFYNENDEESLSNEATDADIVYEEDTVSEENLEGKKANKDEHIDCSNIKTPGLTLIKTADEIEGPKKNPRNASAYLWDCIYFGSYIQSDTDKDGKFDDEKKEPIKWRVLSKDENNKALIVSDKVLDVYGYNTLSLTGFAGKDTEEFDALWHESSIRSWLNGYDENCNLEVKNFAEDCFMVNAFSDKEKAAICKSSLINNLRNNESTEYNTEDYVFLLSYDEVTDAENSFGFANYENRKAQFTDYAISLRDADKKFTDLEYYWLRTCDIDTDGQKYAYCQGGNAYPEAALLHTLTLGLKRGIRPALVVDLDEAVWSYAKPISSDGMEYKELTVHLDSNGGVCPVSSLVFSNFTERYDKASFPPAEKTGCTFMGWSNPEDHPNDVFINEDDVVFTAFYNGGETYDVILDYNDGVSAPYPYTLMFGYDSVFSGLKSTTVPNSEYFLGWFSEPEGGVRVEDTYRIFSNTTFYAHWDTSEIEEGDEVNFKANEMWTSNIDDTEYTGKAIKPKLRVYYGFKRLKEGTDYSLKYLNNIRIAGKESGSSAPAVTVTGKGNYEGKDIVFFSIIPRKVSDSEGNLAEGFSVGDMVVEPTGSFFKPVPTVKYGKKILKENVDFECSYYSFDNGDISPDELTDGVKNAGTYIVRLSGRGIYTGTYDVKLYVSTNKNVGNLSVEKIPTQKYNFADGHEVNPILTVKDGRITLAEGIDYTVSYYDNTTVGTAKAVIRGLGSVESGTGYVGNKTVTFKIEAVSLGEATVNGMDSDFFFDGTAKTFDDIEVVKDNNKLTETIDYEISYLNNVKAGKAYVIITGVGGYKGTVKKSFTIAKLNFNSELDKGQDSRLSVEFEEKVPYAKGGAKPGITVKFNDKVLKSGTDYSLKFANNTKVNDGSGKKIPKVSIKGKGNFAGQIDRTFVIEQQDLGKTVSAVPNKPYKKKVNYYKSKIVIKDLNGKTLSVGKDYDKKFTYVYGNTTRVTNGKNTNVTRFPGDKIESKDIIPGGTYISVTVKAKGNNYCGSKTVIYRITARNISDAKVEIPDFEYTGKEIRPSYSDVLVSVDGNNLEKYSLKCNEDNCDMYSIVGYSNNIKAGTASVTIKGHSNYCGTKTVKFKIKKKKMVWWKKI
ncbi:MAG: DUF6273 domain-containing protein [Lachnospiraceae bacterium]|nr:DUF6273 domain-containing protein [Lachnospiraceae bacterium]